MSEPSPPPGEPAGASSRAFLSVQAMLAVALAVIFALVFLGAFLTADNGLKHDLTEVLKAGLYMVLGYYYGSSIGSRLKDRGAGHG